RRGTDGLSDVRDEGPGLREGGSRGPDWGPSGTPRAHGSGGCENGAQRAHSGRCDAPAARLRQHRQSVPAPCRGSRPRARRAASVLAVLLFGLLPVVSTVRCDLSSQLRADARSGTGGRRLRALRRALVASQISLALVLLSGAGLLVRSFARLSGLDLGFATSHLSVLGVSMPWDKWVASCGGAPPQADSVATHRFRKCMDSWTFQFHGQLVSGFRAIPGVDKASPVAVPPFLGSNVFMTRLMAEGQSEEEIAANPWVGQDFVGP